MILLKSCPKAYTRDQDKAVSPAETVTRVKELLAAQGSDILAHTRRVDTGRLGIPVFMSLCGDRARSIMPARKQMGKGATPEQAEASALMELVERYSFFSLWNREEHFRRSTYSEAEAELGASAIIGVERLLQSVHEDLPLEDARRVLDLVRWRFYPATDLSSGREEYVPLDWFKTLGEFNGSSAGNTAEESILQGACELVERHVCARIDRERPQLPGIDPASLEDAVLKELYSRFTAQGIHVWLKDFSLDMPVPTVGALAYDPATFPGLSEIVFTAGTATSPGKAAIRALTEVAQLAGDFVTGAVYEASGLSKFSNLKDTAWLTAGPLTPLSALPSIEAGDILHELNSLLRGLKQRGFALYSADIAHPALELPAHYSFVPGFHFRERDAHASLGLFVGRLLAEESPEDEARAGLAVLGEIYGQAHFIPFFKGLLGLRLGDCHWASRQFEQAEPLQPDREKQALSAFYNAYALTRIEDWAGAVPPLDRAVALCPEFKEYFNLRGVARFKQGLYEQAALDFEQALQLDRGSAMDLANLGLCHKFMGQREMASSYLQEALKLDPSLDFIHAQLAELRGGK